MLVFSYSSFFIELFPQISPYLGGLGLASGAVAFNVACYYNTIIAWCLRYLMQVRLLLLLLLLLSLLLLQHHNCMVSQISDAGQIVIVIMMIFIVIVIATTIPSLLGVLDI